MNIGGAKVALVSEVLDELLGEYGSETARRSVLFQAALQVCAEESRRVKQGQPPAPLEVLVERARAILDGSQALQPGEPVAAPPSIEEPAIEMLSSQPISPPMEEPAAPPLVEQQEESLGDLFVDEDVGEMGAEKHRRRLPPLLFLAVVGLLAVAGGTFYVYWNSELGGGEGGTSRIVESYPAPQGTPVEAPQPGDQPVQAAAVAPTLTALAPTPMPTTLPEATRDLPVPVEPQVPVVPERAARPDVAARWQGAETMVSPDWAGRAPAFVIHFSSYRERDKAQRDAVTVGKRFGRPAYAARVTLASGVWYRVVLGDFATAQEARAFHADLLARHTPDLGGVYRITAP
jgi:hypothetical protein